MKSTLVPRGRARLRVSRLAWHLGWILALKFVVLTALWQVFIKPYRVQVDAQAMQTHLMAAPSTPSTESTHDRSLSR